MQLVELLVGAFGVVVEPHFGGGVRAAAEGGCVLEYAAALGRRANAATVVLFHHHPERTDEQLDELHRRFEASPQVRPAIQDEVISVVR